MWEFVLHTLSYKLSSNKSLFLLLLQSVQSILCSVEFYKLTLYVGRQIMSIQLGQIISETFKSSGM